MHDLTDADTVQQLAIHEQWHYALNIAEEGDAAKYMCPKTLWNLRKKVTDHELDTVLFPQVTEKLARGFQVDPRQTAAGFGAHLRKKSNLRRLGRLGLLAKCMHRFLVNLKRQPAGLYAALEPELVDRYLGKKALGCFSQVKPSESAQKLASVCQEVFLLVERFGDHPEVNRMLSYRMLHRVLHEHCEVKPGADGVPGEVVAPVTGPPPAAGFSLAHFQMSPEGLVLACPQGEAPLATNCRNHRYRAIFPSPRLSPTLPLPGQTEEEASLSALR